MLHPAPPASPSPPLAKGPIWWYKARIADRAGRHKAQGPEQTPRHVHPAMPGSASRRGWSRIGSWSRVLRWSASPVFRLRIPLRGMRAGNPKRVRSTVREATISATHPSSSRGDVEAAGNVRPGGLVPQVGAERDRAVGCGGQERQRDRSGPLIKKARISSLPRYHWGNCGIEWPRRRRASRRSC
jgi:hypothetical protein